MGLATQRNEENSALAAYNEVSALGESFDVTPMVGPVRGHLDSIKRLLKGDRYIGRGSRQPSLVKSRYCNTFKVSQYGRSVAISSFCEALLGDRALYASLWTLSGNRLICHCRLSESWRCVDRGIQEVLPGCLRPVAGTGSPSRSWGPHVHGQVARRTRK